MTLSVPRLFWSSKGKREERCEGKKQFEISVAASFFVDNFFTDVLLTE